NFDKTEQYTVLKKSIDSLQAVLANQRSNLEILNFQSEIIKTNSNLTNSKFTSADIKNLMDNARKELDLISKSKLKTESEIRLISEELDRYNKQLTSIRLGFSNINLKANVFAARSGKQSLELKYFTNTAFWTPVYAFDFISKD